MYKLHTAANKENEKLENEWIYGPTGTGKTRGVRDKWKDSLFTKNPNKWWDGYQNQETVLIDDFQREHEKLGYHLKIWADHYPFTGEVKGSSMSIRPKRVIVTSNYHPQDIW